MHRSFRIPEILDLIFVQLQNRHPDLHYFGPESRDQLNQSLGRRDFAALARTCKSFQGPALDFLWREQETLTNLLKTLPSHLWKEETRNPWSRRPSRFLHILGPIQPTDWDIPLAYAHRIQRFELRSQMESEFSVQLVDVFKIISSGLPREHLCPNLKDLVFDVVELPDYVVPYIRLFVSPEILNATIFLRSHRPLLPGLPIQYPQLKSLYVNTRFWEDEPMYLDILSTIALKLYRIENLTLHKLDRTAILHLARLPALKSLFLRDLRDLGPLPHFHSQSNSQSPLFPALRDLFLHATTIEFAIEVLHLLSDSLLVDFHVGIPDPATKSYTRRLYVALASHLSHSALRTLSVELPADCEVPTPPGDNASYVIDGHILATLFCFPNLTELSLAPPVGFDIDDATAWDIARAWSNLKSLHLTAATGLHHSTRMSLHGLRAFAKHCPKLTYLDITFNGAISPPFENSPEISQTSLTSLEVGTSPITDPFAVAQFLCGLFPNLETIDSLDEDEASDMDNGLEDDDSRFSRWKQVEAMLLNSKSTSAGADLYAS
ncbi:F-box domain-containing protein [Mycena venus]|uniref:F-box domain-containing protein n=1 Tax=Mycena venus TaxID=2733690 RepID=A0A8H7DF70_9AGAR|nr:F-box domain-containing protein [Mycena venus]